MSGRLVEGSNINQGTLFQDRLVFDNASGMVVSLLELKVRHVATQGVLNGFLSWLGWLQRPHKNILACFVLGHMTHGILMGFEFAV